MEVKFKKWNCIVKDFKYRNGGTVLQLFEVGTGAPVATATIFVDGVTQNLKEDEVVIKNYSENEGMYKCLQDVGIIKYVIAFTELSSYVTNAPICKIDLDKVRRG